MKKEYRARKNNNDKLFMHERNIIKFEQNNYYYGVMSTLRLYNMSNVHSVVIAQHSECVLIMFIHGDYIGGCEPVCLHAAPLTCQCTTTRQRAR